MIGLPADDAVMISAKTGLNIEGVLEALVTRLPPPTGDADKPLTALLVDSWYDQYLGVVILVRVRDGRLKRGMKIRMMSNDAVHVVEQVGVFTPKMIPTGDLGPGEMGYITAAMKTVADCNVGDTVTDDRNPAAEALPGFKPSIPVVWCGLFPVDADDFEKLRESPRQAPPERRQLPLRSRNLRRPRLRLPLRLPGATPFGDHPGASQPRNLTSI